MHLLSPITFMKVITVHRDYIYGAAGMTTIDIEFTRVKLVMTLVVSATNIGRDLAAYFCPANATIYPPY
jgi:hypothetical protein